jgi:hypothetical protein
MSLGGDGSFGEVGHAVVFPIFPSAKPSQDVHPFESLENVPFFAAFV